MKADFFVQTFLSKDNISTSVDWKHFLPVCRLITLLYCTAPASKSYKYRNVEHLLNTAIVPAATNLLQIFTTLYVKLDLSLRSLHFSHLSLYLCLPFLNSPVLGLHTTSFYIYPCKCHVSATYVTMRINPVCSITPYNDSLPSQATGRESFNSTSLEDGGESVHQRILASTSASLQSRVSG